MTAANATELFRASDLKFLQSTKNGNDKKAEALKAHIEACQTLLSGRANDATRDKAIGQIAFRFPEFSIPENASRRFWGKTVRFLGTAIVLASSALLIGSLMTLGFTAASILAPVAAFCALSVGMVFQSGRILVNEANAPRQALDNLRRIAFNLEDQAYASLSRSEKQRVDEQAKVNKATEIAEQGIKKLNARANDFNNKDGFQARGERAILTRILEGLNGTTANGRTSGFEPCHNSSEVAKVIERVLKPDALFGPALLVATSLDKGGKATLEPVGTPSQFLSNCSQGFFAGPCEAKKSIAAMQAALKSKEIKLHP